MILISNSFHRNKFIVTRVMVLQMSIVQGTLLAILNVINTVNPVRINRKCYAECISNAKKIFEWHLYNFEFEGNL